MAKKPRKSKAERLVRGEEASADVKEEGRQPSAPPAKSGRNYKRLSAIVLVVSAVLQMVTIIGDMLWGDHLGAYRDTVFITGVGSSLMLIGLAGALLLRYLSERGQTRP